jgi:hypothetical protein
MQQREFQQMTTTFLNPVSISTTAIRQQRIALARIFC